MRAVGPQGCGQRGWLEEEGRATTGAGGITASRPPHAGLQGVMAGSPLPPLGLGVAGRAPSRRRRRAWAHARTHGGPHYHGPAAPAPGTGAESRAGEGNRRADGKQPKEATDRKRKWPLAPPEASLSCRRFRSSAHLHGVTSGVSRRPQPQGPTDTHRGVPSPRVTAAAPARPARPDSPVPSASTRAHVEV